MGYMGNIEPEYARVFNIVREPEAHRSSSEHTGITDRIRQNGLRTKQQSLYERTNSQTMHSFKLP